MQPGVEVCVQGKVKEYYGLTQLDIKADKKFAVGEFTQLPVLRLFMWQMVKPCSKRWSALKA